MGLAILILAAAAYSRAGSAVSHADRHPDSHASAGINASSSPQAASPGPRDATPQTAPQASPQAGAQAAPSAGQADVSAFEKRLAGINSQITSLRARIEQESRRENTVLSNLARLNLNKSLIQREIAAQDVQMQKAGAELTAIQAGIKDTKARLERDQASIERTLATLYKFGRMNILHYLLQARDIETYSSESKHLTLLARREQDVITEYLRSLDELRRSESALDHKKREMAELIRAGTLKKQELESEARKTEALIREIQKNRATYERTIAELKESGEQLQLMMNRVLNKEWIPPSAFVPFAERKGRLAWPIDGATITAFGPQRSSHFNTTVMNNGIEIAPRKDKALVAAVHDGKVVFADYFQGYGNLLILDHGMSYYSLYGHCAEFLVSVGDMVKAGQTIALVGDSGSLKGICLYFEIRHKAKALDPLPWLKRKG